MNNVGAQFHPCLLCLSLELYLGPLTRIHAPLLVATLSSLLTDYPHESHLLMLVQRYYPTSFAA